MLRMTLNSLVSELKLFNTETRNKKRKKVLGFILEGMLGFFFVI